jgi:urocanate hydratase
MEECYLKLDGEELEALDRFAYTISKELKTVNESLHMAVENLNRQGIEARVYFNAENGILSAIFYPKGKE